MVVDKYATFHDHRYRKWWSWKTSAFSVIYKYATACFNYDPIVEFGR